MKTLPIVAVNIVLALTLSCSSPTSPVNGNGNAALIGTWDQVFTQEIMPQISPPEERGQTYPVTFRSRVMLYNDTFRIELSVPADPHLGTYVQRGWFRVERNTLTLIYGGTGDMDVTHERYYHIDLAHGTLTISCLPFKKDGKVVAIELVGAFWETSVLCGFGTDITYQRSGTFERIRAQRHRKETEDQS